MYSSNQKKKNFMLVGILLFVIITMLSIAGIILYLKTDIFKSDEQLFKRQFMQNMDVINQFIEISSEGEYRKLIEENSFNETTALDLKYTDNEGKEDNFKGNITGINNNKNSLAYKDIKIDFLDKNVMNLTYLKENEIYGIRFLKGTKFAVIDFSGNISPVLNYFGIDEIINIDKVKSVKLSDLITLSKEEIKQFENTYLSIILETVSKDNFSSKKQCSVTMGNQNIMADAYVLTIEPEQVKNINGKVLEQLSKDEIILSKLEKIDSKIEEAGIIIDKKLKTAYVDNIKKRINSIEAVASEMVLTVYEVEGTTIKTTIEYGNEKIEISINNNNDINIRFLENGSEKVQESKLSIKKQNNKMQIKYEDSNNMIIELVRQLSINNNDINSVLNVKYSDNNIIKNLEFNVDRKIKLGVADEIPTSFEKAGKVLLNDYDNESTNKNLRDLKNRIIDSLRTKRDENNSILLNYIIKYNNEIEDQEKVEQENKRKKFNNKFELYEGETKEKDIVFNMLDEAGKNMSNYQTIGDNKIKIIIEEGKKNKELANEIKNILSAKEGISSYNISVGYNKNAKINQITIELIQPEDNQ